MEEIVLIKKINCILNKIYLQQISNKFGVYIGKNNIESKIEHKYCVSVSKKKGVSNIPYSKFYNKNLLIISNLIDQIMSLKLQDRIVPYDLLIMFKKTLLTNDRDELESVWLSTINVNNNYLWTFGPIESYSDSVFGIKKFFSGLLAKKMKEKNINKFINLIYDNVETFSFFMFSNNSIPYKKTLFFVGNIVHHVGECKKISVGGRSRPESLDLYNKYGSVKQIYVNSLKKRINKYYIPLINLFGSSSYSIDAIMFMNANYIKYVVVHEICHTIGKYSGYKDRILISYPSFEEVRADLLSYLFLFFLEKEGKIDRGMSEKFIFVNFFSLLHMFYLYHTKGIRKAYHDLFCIFRYCFKDNIVFESNTFLFLNKNLFVNIQSFYSKIDRIASSGKDEDFNQILLESQEFVFYYKDIILNQIKNSQIFK